MNIYDAIEKRRTIRKFKGPATDDQIQCIIKEGIKAPSPRNMQSWEFIIVDDTDLIEKIGEIKYIANRGKPRGESVPEELEQACQVQKESFAYAGLILVYHGLGDAHAAGAWCCIQNMLLAAIAEGLGTKISYFREGAEDALNTLMRVPDEFKLAAAISVGIPAEEPAPRALQSVESRLHRNRFS